MLEELVEKHNDLTMFLPVLEQGDKASFIGKKTLQIRTRNLLMDQ
jgi:hypothetical protein